MECRGRSGSCEERTPDTVIPSDHDLLRGMREGDEAAFTALYRRWQGPLYRYALRVSGSTALAEDVTQEVFMALLRRNEGYDPSRGELSSYLHGIARNLARRRLERERGHLPLADEAGPDDPLADLVRRERTDLVWEGILGLPLHYREVVVLCDLQGLSYEEAASALGCAVGTVRSRLHRGREQLGVRLRSARPVPAAQAVPRMTR
ncbi:MAG: RNA polymerase subunit sigma-70 [Acidobacteria bacterium]|nr:MAG: RNA polymerase subunit sigma-70 [Acidobacteriota bacterium]